MERFGIIQLKQPFKWLFGVPGHNLSFFSSPQSMSFLKHLDKAKGDWHLQPQGTKHRSTMIFRKIYQMNLNELSLFESINWSIYIKYSIIHFTSNHKFRNLLTSPFQQKTAISSPHMFQSHRGAMTPNRARFKGRFTSPAPASASSADRGGVTALLALIAPAAASASQVATGWPAATSASLKTSTFFSKWQG